MKIIAVLFAVLAAAGVAHAQQWPAKPVRIILSNGSGSLPDVLMRMVAERLGNSLGQSFLIVNRTGGNAIVGAEAAAKAAPDGYTYYVSSPETHAMNVFQFKSLPYDPDRDFTAVANIGSAPFVVAVHPDVPAKTYPEFIAYAKKTGRASMGVGVGMSDVLAQWMNVVTGTHVLPVRYKSAPLAGQDAAGGQVTAAIVSLGSIAPLVKAGKLRIIAVTSSGRFPPLPDMPRLADAYPDLIMEGWIFLVAPTGTPPSIVQRMNSEINTALTEPKMVERMMSGYGFSTREVMTPEVLQERIKEMRVTWQKIAHDIKMEAQ